MTQAAQLAQYGANNVGLSFKNRFINGNMVLDQRNSGASVIPDSLGIYTLDRWRAWEDTDGAATVQQSSAAPDGFTNSFLWTTTTADASLTAAQYACIGQLIEGYNVADLAWGTANAQPVTLSFWVRSSLTGTFGGSFQNSAQNRSYPFTYTISAANTWEYKTITVPGETSGTWLTTNGVGIRVYWGLGVGSTYSGTANAWASSTLLSTTGATSVIGTLNATWQVTGVQLEKGTVATSYDYLPYSTQLALCQRYFWRSYGTTSATQPIGRGYDVASAAGINCTIWFPVLMRATPTLTKIGTFSVVNSSQPTLDFASPNGFEMYSTNTATGGGVFYPPDYSVYVTASAEL